MVINHEDVELRHSTGSEWERRRETGRDAPPMSSHARRSRLVLSDNPRWFAGTEQAVHKHAVAELLRGKFPDGVFLYNRRVSAGMPEGNIDIIALLGSGVWVIEVENATGTRVATEGRRGLFGSRHDRLVIGTTDQAQLLTVIGRKAAAVRAAAPESHAKTTVQQVLCLVHTRLPWSGERQVGHVAVVAPRSLVKLLHGRGHLADTDITPLALALGERLPRPRLRG